MARPLDWLRVKDAINTSAVQRVAELEALVDTLRDERDYAQRMETRAFSRAAVSERTAREDRAKLDAIRVRLEAAHDQANQARADHQAAARNASQLASQVQAQGESLGRILREKRIALEDLAKAQNAVRHARDEATEYRSALRGLIRKAHVEVARDASSAVTAARLYAEIKRLERTHFAPQSRPYFWQDAEAAPQCEAEVPQCESPYLRTFTAGPGERTHVAMSDPAHVSANLNHAAATGAGLLLGDLEPRSVLIDRVRNLEGLLAEAEAEREAAIARGTETANYLRKMRASASALIRTLENLTRTLPVGTPAHTAAKNAYDAYYKGT